MNQVSPFSLKKRSLTLSSSYFCCNVTGEAFVDGLLSTQPQMVNVIYIVGGGGWAIWSRKAQQNLVWR